MDTIKKDAQIKVMKALKEGLLIKGSCAICGTNINVGGHHPDYSNPLDVVWLCKRHHRIIHIIMDNGDGYYFLEKHKAIRSETQIIELSDNFISYLTNEFRHVCLAEFKRNYLPDMRYGLMYLQIKGNEPMYNVVYQAIQKYIDESE